MRHCVNFLVFLELAVFSHAETGLNKPISIMGPYTPLWPHDLPCYCYTHVVEVYKSTLEWVRASPKFAAVANKLTKEQERMLNQPNSTLFLPLATKDSNVNILMHLVEGMALAVADFDFGTTSLYGAAGNTIYVHKDFYCYLTIRADTKPRFEYQNTDDRLAGDIKVVLPDIKTDNGFVHVISRPIVN